MVKSFELKHSLLLLSLTAAYPLQAFAATPAGVAQFTVGDVNVRSGDGQTSALTKGKNIESGQAILTGASGRAQVKFTDGGIISLQPNTEFKIANYVDKLDPKEDRFLVDLLRGSMRAITGLIGKRNRENYKVVTTTATIGIRGSGFNAGYNQDGSLGVTAEKDAIEVCNTGGCVGLVAGESVIVNNSIQLPVRTINRASVPTPGPAQEVATAGNESKSDGKSAAVPPAPVIVSQTPAPAVQPFTGNLESLEVRSVYDVGVGGALYALSSPPDAVIVNNNEVISISNPFTTNSVLTTGSSASAGSIAGGDFISWGLWTGALIQDTVANTSSTKNNLHYVAGIPTVTMPISGSLTYNFVGGTTPTLYTGASGTISSATFAVDFSSAIASTNIITSFGAVSSTAMYISGSSFVGNAGTIKGFFSGPGAARAGLVYSGFSTSAQGYFSGAAVFQRPMTVAGSGPF